MENEKLSTSSFAKEKKGEKPISSPAELAKRLGYKKVEGNPNWLMEYGKDEIYLIFQNAKYGGEQRISLNFLRDEDGKYAKSVNLCKDPLFEDFRNESGLALGQTGMFIRKDLDNGGYDRICQLFQEDETEKYLEKTLTELKSKPLVFSR